MGTVTGEQSHRTIRIVSVIAATGIALSCGTNYAYSAWSPQFAERLALTATESNLIGNAGNIGMYAMGIPGGILIDSKGPRWGVLAGSIALACGYFALRAAYLNGPGSTSVAAMCFFGLLTGVGSCTAFSASLKVCATNWPQHRGTATAFPLSAFGLSALFYTVVAGLILPHDTAGYLLVLACGTTAMVFVGMFFLHMVQTSASYQAVPSNEGRRVRKDSNPMQRSHESDHENGQEGADTVDESSSLVSSTETGPGDIDSQPSNRLGSNTSHTADITGVQLFMTPQFWQLFVMLSLLSGVGLMTINNIGNDARTLWHRHDGSASHDFIQRRQLMHVSILSGCSFLGRLASGIGSDALIHRGASRFWTLVASALLFAIAQVVALLVSNPEWLFLLSSLTGLAYGALFGVYPALVADAFGPRGMGINWGAMILAPVLTGNIFNVVYGRILDQHSRFEDIGNGDGRGERVCDEGKACYAGAYWVTLVSSIVGVCWSLWCIRQERRAKKSLQQEQLD